MKIQNPTITQITALTGSGANLTGSFSGALAATNAILSSSAQIGSDISGSLGANAALIRTLTATSISESLSATAVAALGAGLVSGSSIASSAQGEVALTTNGVAATAVDLGLKTDDDVTFASVTTTGNVTIAGDLNVTGDTIQAQVTNLNVEDKFILLNSGSATGDAGIVFGGAGGATPNTGDGIFYDDSDSVFAYAENIASNATSATNASKLGNIEVASADPSSAPTFQGIGTIHINDDNEGIWIYS